MRRIWRVCPFSTWRFTSLGESDGRWAEASAAQASPNAASTSPLRAAEFERKVNSQGWVRVAQGQWRHRIGDEHGTKRRLVEESHARAFFDLGIRHLAVAP